jgi:hypothetical protein
MFNTLFNILNFCNRNLGIKIIQSSESFQHRKRSFHDSKA